MYFFFFQAEDGIRDKLVTGVQTCALPIYTTQSQEANERRLPVAPLAQQQRHERREPEHGIDDRHPVGVVPTAAPGQERPQPVRPLPVEIEVTQHGRRNAQGEPSPGRRGLPPAARPPQLAEPHEQGERSDLDGGAQQRVRNPAVPLEVGQAGAGWPDARGGEQLAPVGGVARDGADQSGSADAVAGDGPAQSGADERVREVVHGRPNIAPPGRVTRVTSRIPRRGTNRGLPESYEGP